MNLAAGEHVRWLPRHGASDLLFPGNDYWLVDEHLLFNLFAGDGSFVGVELSTDVDLIAVLADLFDRAWRRGVDHTDYQPT
jgi:hypothetical protein